MKIPSLTDDDIKLQTIGKSGEFRTRHKHAVEYLQTTLPINKLKLIDPVRRKFKKGELDFELMLQRDLDDVRVREDIIPYLKRDKKLSFFPPILVVILEIEDNKGCTDIKDLYPKMIPTTENEDGNEYDVRSFGKLFSIHIYQVDNVPQRWCTKLKVGHSATLLAIDGQHRLVALQAVAGLLDSQEANLYDPSPAEFKEEFQKLEVPVTFVFIPDSHQKDTDDEVDTDEKLTAVFRQIFVDVNRNARTVSKMRNVLLEEHDVRSVFTRYTCSFLREKSRKGRKDYISIDEVEWDKETQEDQLSSPIAITNIMFMKEIFDDWIQKDQDGDALKSFLRLDKYKGNLDESAAPYDDLKVDEYSHTQKEKLKKIFEDHYKKGFADLFSSIPFAMERSSLVYELKNNLDKCAIDPDHPDSRMAFKVREFLFDGNEHKSHNKISGFEPSKKEFLKALDKFEEDHFLSFIRTAMFQIAYLKLIKILYGLVDNDDFNEFSLNFRKITENKKFLNLWKDVIIKNRTQIEHALKSRYSYAKGKKKVVFEFLKIIFKNNSGIFKSLDINWERLDTNVEYVRNSFLSTYNKRIEDEEERTIKKKVKSFEEFLSRVYLPKP